MARAPLNKTELARSKRHLETYRRFLPALDMKRKQLQVACRQAQAELEAERAQIAERHQEVGDAIPMLADTDVAVDGLVRVAGVDLGTGHVVGVPVPRLDAVRFEATAPAYLGGPPWRDALAERVRAQVQARLREQVAEARLARLRAALKTVTQRVNLFEKVLIPRTETRIARIQIALADAERAGVVRAKIAKRKHTAEAPAS